MTREAPSTSGRIGGGVVTRFVYASRANAPDAMVRDGATYRLVTDHLGSVRLVVDVATGAVAQRLRYDAFGAVREDSAPGFQPFGFAGGLYDPDTGFVDATGAPVPVHGRDTGLVRSGARDYDPLTGRWTARDPSGFGGGDANLYAYVGNDPVNFVDPAGRFATVAASMLVGAVEGGGLDFVTQAIGNLGTNCSIDGRAVAGAALAGALAVPALGMALGQLVPRALTAEDLGLNPANLTRLEGTFAVQDGVATARVAMIEGDLGASGLGAIRSLAETARAAGATTLRIESTLANERLFNVRNARYGVTTEGAIDIITVPLRVAR